MKGREAKRQRLAQLQSLAQRIEDEMTVLEHELRQVEPVRRRRRPRNVKPPCGTEEGYQWHRYRNEPRCPACKRGHAAHVRVQKARRRLAEHGEVMEEAS